MLVYLDNSSTTRQYDQVTDKMAETMRENYGNPSSLHRLGLKAEKEVKAARKSLAKSLGAKDDEVIFTSGGTESDNTFLLGYAQSKKRVGNKIITSKVEHPAILEACKTLEDRGFKVAYIGVDKQCRLDMEQLKNEINDNTILISAMTVNNESGTIMPIREIAHIKDQYNKDHGTSIALHTDAVQAFGKMNLAGIGADAISVSGHKIHGPKGIGGLFASKDAGYHPLIVGGGQEMHMRSGTENTPAIVGLGTAIDISMASLPERVASMSKARNYLLEGIENQIKDINVNGVGEDTLTGESNLCCPSVLNVSFQGTRGEVILHTLEQDEIYVSTGSACSSNKKGQSHVLEAMGMSFSQIEGALRFSFNEFNTISEMDYVLDRLVKAVGRFRKLGSFR